MRKLNILITALLLSFLLILPVGATDTYFKNLTTGGTSTALDGVDGDDVADGDRAIVKGKHYSLDASYSGSENDPFIISPDSNPGTKRWILDLTIANKFYVDPSETDICATGNGNTIKSIVDTIGGTEKATIVFIHTGAGNTTTYTCSTNETVSSNFILEFEEGALIAPDASRTLTVHSFDNLIRRKGQQIIDTTSNTTDPLKVTVGTGPCNLEVFGVDGTSDEIPGQLCNDAFPSDGGTVELLADTTYVFSAPNEIVLAGGTKDYAVQPKSNVSWVGGGYNTVIQMEANQTAEGNDPGLFVTNIAYQNVRFEKFRVDLNGANNDIASNLNTPAIWVSGDSAYAKNIKIDKMWFENCPGLNFVVLGQSNSDGATLGDNIVISNSTFYQGGLDAQITDHSSVYTWAENVRIIDNLFLNESSNTTGWSYACGWELHGSNNIAIGNTVKRYARGCYVGTNYVSATSNQVVANNNFELITRGGVVTWLSGANAKALSDIIVTGNNIEVYDMDVAGGAFAIEVLFGVSASVGITNFVATGNIITKLGGTDQKTRALSVQPQNSQVLRGLKFAENTIQYIYNGAYLDTTNGSITTADISRNAFINLGDSDETVPIGIFTKGATGITTLKMHDNHFVENNATNKFDYGIYLGGKIVRIERQGNTYEGIVTADYIEVSLTNNTTNVAADKRVEAITANGALATWGDSDIDSTAGALASLTLADGKYIGQQKFIVMTVDNGDATLAIANHTDGAPYSPVFDAVGEHLLLVWGGAVWVTVVATCTMP